MMSLPAPASTERLLPPPLIITLSLPAPLATFHGLTATAPSVTLMTSSPAKLAAFASKVLLKAVAPVTGMARLVMLTLLPSRYFSENDVAVPDTASTLAFWPMLMALPLTEKLPVRVLDVSRCSAAMLSEETVPLMPPLAARFTLPSMLMLILPSVGS